MFEKIKVKAVKDEKERIKAYQARLEVFLSAVAKLEEEHHCEIQAEIKVTRSAIVAIPNAVVHPIPEPTNAQPTAQLGAAGATILGKATTETPETSA